MSWEATGWALTQRAGGPGPKAVLMVLAEHADERGLSWPSTRTLAEEAECDQRTVRRHLAQLRDGGLVDWKPGAGRGSNRYRLTMPEPAPRGSRRGPVVRRNGASQAAESTAVVRPPDASLPTVHDARSEAPADRSEASSPVCEPVVRQPASLTSTNASRTDKYLEPKEIEPTAATQQYARRGEHVAPAELDRTAASGSAFVIVAAWAERNPGVANGHRRELGKAVDALLRQGVDHAHIPAALDAAHASHWRNPVRALPMAYEDVRRAAAQLQAPAVAAHGGRQTPMATTTARFQAAQALKRPDPEMPR